MPYIRRGKCVYKRVKRAGKIRYIKKGCYKTVEGAKAYMRALYHAEAGREFTRSK